MKQKKLFESFLFIVGFTFALCVNLCFISFHKKNYEKLKLSTKVEVIKSQELYEHELTDFLFNEVKILCWVFTHPDNHKTKVPYVRQTWGRRCNKLLFMSVEDDPDQPDIIALPVENGREHLWNKTRLAMKYVYENHFNDADWFMRADDDNYIVMENLRYKLYQFNYKTSIHIGCRFKLWPNDEGYMPGGGQIFSKKALEKFVKIESNSSLCQQDDSEWDDVLVGSCLRHHALLIDAHDDKNEKQMFPVRIEVHMEHNEPDMNYWYYQYLWNNVTQGGLGCCSDTFIELHYVKPEEMYLLEFLIYQMHPFGIEKNLTEKMPRKLSLDEIIKEADAPRNFSINFDVHEIIHYIDDDEKF